MEKIKNIIKYILMIFITAISIFSIVLTQVFSSYSSEKVIANLLKNNDDEIVAIHYNKQTNILSGHYIDNSIIHDDSYRELLDKNNVKYVKFIENNVGIIENKQDLLNLGFEFWVVDDITIDGFYVTDYWIDRQIYLENTIRIDDVEYKLDKTIHTYEKIMNNIVVANGIRYKVNGIIKTNYKDFYNESFVKKELNQTQKRKSEFYEKYIFESKFIIKGSDYFLSNTHKPYVLNKNTNFENVVVTEKKSLNIDSINIYTNSDINDDEIYISSSLYNRIFNKTTDFSQQNEQIRLILKRTDKNKDIINDDFKIKVVDNSFSNNGYDVYFSTKVYQKYSHEFAFNSYCLIDATQNIDYKKIFEDYRKNYSCGTDSPYTFLYTYEVTFENYYNIFIIISIVFSLLSFLCSFGAFLSKFKLKCFAMTSIVSFLISVITIISTISLVNNNNAESLMIEDLKLLSLNVFSFVFLVCFGIILPLIVIALALLAKYKRTYKISKKVIKQNETPSFKKESSFKYISTIIITTISIFSIVMAQVFSSYSSEKIIAKALRKNNEEIAVITYNPEPTKSLGQYLYDESTIHSKSYKEILEKNNIEYVKFIENKTGIVDDNHLTQKYNIGLINSKKDLLDLGLEFWIANEISDNGYYLTDYWVDKQIYLKNKIIINNQEEILDKDIHTYENILNNEIVVGNDTYQVDGIIKTNYKNYYNDYFEEKDLTIEEINKKDFYYKYIYRSAYIKESSNYFLKLINHPYCLNENTYFENKISTKNDTFDIKRLYLSNNYSKLNVVSNENYIDGISLKHNEIIVSVEIYNKLFNNELKIKDERILATPSHLDEEIELNFTRTDLDKEIIKGKFVIKGILEPYYSNGSNYIYLSQGNFLEYGKDISPNYFSLIKTTNVSKMTKIFKEYRYNYSCSVDSPYTPFAYSNEKNFLDINVIVTFIIVGVVFLILSIILLLTIYSKNKYNNILVIDKDKLIKMHFKEVIIVGTIITLLSIFFLLIFIGYQNYDLFIITEKINMNYIWIDIVSIIMVVFISYVIVPSISLISIKKYLKK